MKKLFPLLVLALYVMSSCNSVDTSAVNKKDNSKTIKIHTAKSETNEEFRVNTRQLLKDFQTWYYYTYYNIKLSQDFVGLDVDSSVIGKAKFLKRLSTGNFVPLKIMMKDNLPFYKLYNLGETNSDIKRTIEQMALNETEHFNMEGKELPSYNFTDLTGNTYNGTNTRGKILVLKCWFIRCVACVKEFPELNKLVYEYKDRDDILFVSLAPDSKEDLTLFLQKKQFKYHVVSNKREYVRDQLAITEFPTHILVNKNGKIVKVTNSIEDLIPFIKRETDRNLAFNETIYKNLLSYQTIKQ